MEVNEFDATLGGSEHLPDSVKSLKFATSRSVEIAAMTESILNPSKIKLIFQSLPVHMRRRVMSHNTKRLPIKLRKGHLEQLIKSGLPPKQKRPSRKYRRRPSNLLEEYNRRQKHIWLETHIWHAKRFHMTERWGHRLANAPCDKAFRACYRASSANCLLQDISYYTPFKITGTVDDIKNIFSVFSNPSCGLTVGAKAHTTGNREGEIHLYEAYSFPYGYMGKAEIIWEPSSDESRTMWMFVHPSFSKQVESSLTNILNPVQKDADNAVNKRRKITNKISENVTMKVLPGAFNRFCLIGPNSHAILSHSLKCADALEKIKNNKWVTQHINHNPELHLKEKNEYWTSISPILCPSQLPPRMVLGLIVKDPRLTRPNYRTKAKPVIDPVIDRQLLVSIPSFAPISPLWNTNIHKTIKDKAMTNGQYIKHITKMELVPGQVYEDDPALQSIPVILVQKPGSQDSRFKKLGYGSGWNIIIPSGYGLPFWLTFIMFGARSGGLREAESVAFEKGECYLPPDSEAGKLNEKRIEDELKDRYFRLPPSKRVNYIKLGIISPFICPWKILLKDWTDISIDDFYIMRDWSVLDDLQECVTKKKCLPEIDNTDSCLIAVYLHLPAGSLKRNALICLPQRDDIKNIKSLFEPNHRDHNERLRKLKRKEHFTTLKQLRRSRIKLKKKNIKINSAKNKSKNKQEPSDYVKIMRELWLPSNIDTVRTIGSRETMGFVSQGAFSFTEAHSCGIGYVPYKALNTLLKSGLNQVLVRNTSSRKYRLAKLEIIKCV